VASALGATLCLFGAIAVLLVPLLVPRPTNGPTGRFMAVQGDVPQAGLDFNAQRRAVLDNHARVTLQAAAAWKAPGVKGATLSGSSQPDLVVWPENSSDIDPLDNPDAANVIRGVLDTIKAPLGPGCGSGRTPADGDQRQPLVSSGKGP